MSGNISVTQQTNTMVSTSSGNQVYRSNIVCVDRPTEENQMNELLSLTVSYLQSK
jgi:hypothetical protein